MSARQGKKRKGRNHANNRERTVTTFQEDPNTSFLVPHPSEEPSPFPMPFQSYIPAQQQHFYPHVPLPPGANDLEILENLKTIIKEGQHKIFRADPQPAALASLYCGRLPHAQDASPPASALDPAPDTAGALDTTPPSANNTAEPHSPLSCADTSPNQLRLDTPNVAHSNPASSVHADPEDDAQITAQDPADAIVDTMGEYGPPQPVETASSDKATPLDTTQADDPSHVSGENTWDHSPLDDRKPRYDDRNSNLPPSRASTYDSRPNGSGASAADSRIPPQDDRRFYDRDRDRDRFTDRDRDWDRDRDRDRHDSFRDTRDRDVRDRRPEFFGRSYGRSHAPRPPPELRHYEPSYGADYVPPPRRFDPDDRRGGLRNGSFDDRFKPPPFDDRRPPLDDRRPPPPADDRRSTVDDRPIRPLPGADTRPSLANSEDRTRPVGDRTPLSRVTADDNRSIRGTSLAADDRPRTNIPLEERISQPAPTPSLQDRLSQPVVPVRVDISSAPSLEERLSLGPVPRSYTRAPSVVRDDLRPPLPKDDPRDHDHSSDFRANRDFSRERPSGPLHTTTSTYRPDLDRNFADRDDRDRRDRDGTNVDGPPARFGDTFNRPGPPPPRRYSPPPSMYDRDRERGRARYPTRSPPPFRGEGMYDQVGERRYTIDRERDAYEQRRRDWYGPGDDDKRGLAPPPPAPWRPNERLSFVDRDRDRFDRERERDRDVRDRDRERDRDLGGLAPPPPRSHWEDRDRRPGFPPSPPPSRMDPPGAVGSGRSLSARLTDPYPGSGNDERTYPPPQREFDRGRYGGPPLDDHVPPPFSRVRNRSPSLPRRGLGLAEDLRPPLKRVRDDSGPGYLGVGGGGSAYSPLRRGGGVGVGGTGTGEYTPGPPPSSAATTTTIAASVNSTVPPRSAGARTPPGSAAPPPSTGASSAFYERGGIGDREREQRERERERERDYVRGEYAMGYDRDGRGRRSPPPLLSSRMGPGPGAPVGGGGYGRSVVGDRRDDRRYIPPPPRTS